jgi:hypothetical protein
MKKRFKWYALSTLAFILIAGITFGSSVYAKTILSPSENVAVWVAFPIGNVTKPMTVSNPSGGKIFVKPIVIDIQQQGILKKTFSHWLVGLSTHWVVNVGKVPCRVGLSFAGPDIPIEWNIRSGFAFDETSQTFGQSLEPGQMVPNLVFEWVFDIPENVRSQPVLYEGALIVSNADNGEKLSSIPIKIINGGSW